ncbi:MAG: MarR family transcriptional regulator, partial [Bacteroidota bacterium]
VKTQLLLPINNTTILMNTKNNSYEKKSEYEQLILNLSRANAWLENCQNKVLKRYDLAIPQYNVLRILRKQAPEPANVALITRRMTCKMSNASRIVDRLERKGFVARMASYSDRRTTHIFITREGLDVLVKIEGCQQDFQVQLEPFSVEEAQQLNQLLKKLRQSTLSKM